MFTIEQLQATHSKVKSGADFPKYVQDMKLLGVRSYEHFVIDGHTTYHGDSGYIVTSATKWPNMPIAPSGNISALNHSLAIHQKGQTDYRKFCQEAAEAGVEKWIVDMAAMKCSYYDKAGNLMLAEEIPLP